MHTSLEIQSILSKNVSGRLLLASFSPTALLLHLTKALLIGRSFGKGKTKPRFVERQFVVEIIRTGFLVSGFYLPERAAELSREEPSFTISFFLPNNNQADPGKPAFSIGEKKASHIETLTKQIDCWKDMLL